MPRQHKMMQPPPAGKHTPPRAERVRAIAEALDALVTDEQATPAWEWIVWRLWARTPGHARRIGEREGVRVTKIGRDLYGHRADLDALAAKNALNFAGENDTTTEDLDPEIAAAFASGGSR